MRRNVSKQIYVPCAVSSFFEICDTEPDGSKIRDELKIGARGGGFVIERGNTSIASISRDNKDRVSINGKLAQDARTSLRVIELIRKDFGIPPAYLTHQIEPPIGSGFGTSGSGAIGTAMALSDLLDLRLTLSQVSDYAHRAEIQSVTGLGTVISLVSGSGAIGLVTEPGSFSIGRVDSLLDDYAKYNLVCICYGPIEKSTIILNKEKRFKLNKCGQETMRKVLRDRTAKSLLANSRIFAEKSGIASSELLALSDKAVLIGASGATQNMIGNAVHCLVLKSQKKSFLSALRKIVPGEYIFQSNLSQSGPRIL